MTRARLLTEGEQRIGPPAQSGASALSGALPRLSIEAKRLSANVAAGIHGRRRAGPGETFWQFRSFVQGEPVSRIDWRRTARDDRITIRDREWEAAQSAWLWIDRSASMQFVSELALAPKSERAVVLGLALADMLVRGGERVGLIGLTPAMAHRAIIDRLAERLAAAPPADPPEGLALPPRSDAVLISDFIVPPETLRQRIGALAQRGARGHLVMIVDPAEETFPFTGHNEFQGPEDGSSLRVGDAAGFAPAYRIRMAAHRAEVRAVALAYGWTCITHRTDRPASEILLALRMMLESGAPAAGAGAAS